MAAIFSIASRRPTFSEKLKGKKLGGIELQREFLETFQDKGGTSSCRVQRLAVEKSVDY